MIYFDNSATTKPYPEVLETYATVARDYFANPSSIHSFGGTSETLLSKARSQAASILGVSPSEIIFTSGGTEGSNLAIKGTALYYQNRGKHIITSEVEHPATFNACQQLESLGFDVTYLRVNSKGQVNPEEIGKALREDTILVSLIHVNNELGSVQSLEAIGELIKKHPKTLLHVDHVQGYSKVPLNFKKLGLDLCTLSGHKFHAPKGTGLLYVKDGVRLSPLLSGGGQEADRRSGTENLPGIVAMVKAMRLSQEKARSGVPRMQRLTKQLREGLTKHSEVIIHTPIENAAPHILSLSVVGIKPEVLIHALDKEGIYISTKSACSSKKTEVSRVLLAAGINEDIAKFGIRISLSFENTEEEVATFLYIFDQTINQLQKVMR